MTKKLILTTLLFLTLTPCLRAQKKEIAQARSYVKSGKDLDKAEKLLDGLLERDSASRQNPKVHALLFRAIYKQYEAGNEKLYLGLNYDTTFIFNITRRLFFVAERFDSLDARPDRKGRVRPEYRSNHAEVLHQIRRNLYLGGRYFLRHNTAEDAFAFFDAYLDCARQPLFTDYHYAERDTLMSDVAYWACYAGLRENQPDHILKYAALALQDTTKASYTLQYVAQAYFALGDSAHYEQTLLDGFYRYPEHGFYYPRLLDYYSVRLEYDQALQLSDAALQINPLNELFLFGRSTVLLNVGRNEESLELSRQLIAINNTLTEPYFNAATALLNQLAPLENNPRRNRAQIRHLYEQARPYMERYRKLAPAQQQKWAPALYKIYLNLNMGRQFEEIDKLLKK